MGVLSFISLIGLVGLFSICFFAWKDGLQHNAYEEGLKAGLYRGKQQGAFTVLDQLISDMTQMKYPCWYIKRRFYNEWVRPKSNLRRQFSTAKTSEFLETDYGLLEVVVND